MLPANDEATPQVFFITHEVIKIGAYLRYHLILLNYLYGG